MNQRADFSAATRKILAARAGYQCSVLNCGRLTVGPGPGPAQVVDSGMAAHIYSASPGGPRGTGGLSATELREPENGIWCCYSHGKAIDSAAGNAYSAAQLKAWKRLHEARKNAEMTGAPHDRFGLVESISVNSAPVLAGRKFELGMRNIITGPNESGKSTLTRLLASPAYPDHVAEMSRDRNVDIEVRWFDPYIHDLATAGRSGHVSHILDSLPVPYVARPYKTILINRTWPSTLESLVRLSQMFDLGRSAMEATLNLLPESSELVKEVHVRDTHVDWVLEKDGRIIRDGVHRISQGEESLILLELAGIHASHHARVEPTLLLVDDLLGRTDTVMEIRALQRLQTVAEHAQIAVISYSQNVVAEIAREWQLTALEPRPRHDTHAPSAPIDFEIETTTPPPTSYDPPRAS
jgi:ABC-type cobalamin/Fe3+-siderophores transport system ATPase subunit